VNDSTVPRFRFRYGWRAAALVFSLALSAAVARSKPASNYSVVVGAASDMLAGRNPYQREPGLDFFKYSPLAALLMAPFVAVPLRFGIFVFVLAQALFFFWAFTRWSRSAGLELDRRPSLAMVGVLSIALDLATSLQNCQVNAGIFALMMLAAAQYAERAETRAGLTLSLATNVKLYPFTLALCLMTGLRARFWLSFLSGLLLSFLLPAAVVGSSANQVLHWQWYERMTHDRGGDLSMLDLGSFLELHLHRGDLGELLSPTAIAIGIALGLSSFALFRRGEEERLNRFLPPLTGLYVLLFSYLSESPTSVLAVAGIYLIGARAFAGERVSWSWAAAWAVALALVPLFYTDLVPSAAERWARSAHLKTAGYLYLFVMSVGLALAYQARTRPVSR
jgi:hypothetical protein